jgi:hypothetical protein
MLVGSLLLLGLAAARVSAEGEPVEAHTQHPMKTIVLDDERIVPSRLTMAAADSLVFENHSVHPMRVSFTSPDGLAERIRCGLVKSTPKEPDRAPWLLFAWDDGKLVATIPPGRFASVCSLQKGSYVFLVAAVGVEPRQEGSGGGSEEKGQIVVQ